MDELIVRVNEAVGQGDWDTAVLLGGRLYGMASTCGDRAFAEVVRDMLGWPCLWWSIQGLSKISRLRLWWYVSG